MTEEQFNKIAQTYLLMCHNSQQDEIFKGGGIPMPKFKTIEEMNEFFKIMNESFPIAKGKFKENPSHEEIIFDIPDRYK